MFKVVTDPGNVLTDAGENKGGNYQGLSEDQAKASADRRNASAKELGLDVRYVVAPL